MQKKIEYMTMLFLICGLVLTGCGKSVVLRGEEDVVSSEIRETESVSATSEDCQETELPVHVCGAVKNPGVYYLRTGDIKNTAIEMAGGFLENAHRAYVNLAEPVEYGEQIYVPTVEELAQQEQSWLPEHGQESEGRININTATKEELMTLPGIGETKADAIIQYRQTHGAFTCPSDIMNIAGIKEGVYDKIKDLIVAE